MWVSWRGSQSGSHSPSNFLGTELGRIIAFPTDRSINYAVSTNPLQGYHQTFNDGCSGTLLAGYLAICHLGVTDNIDSASSPPRLTVYTRVISSDGLMMHDQNDKFYMRVNDSAGSIHSFRDFGTGHLIYLAAGQFKVTPSGPSGFTAIPQGTCFGVINMGNDVVCTMTMRTNPVNAAAASNYPPPASSELQRQQQAIVIS